MNTSKACGFGDCRLSAIAIFAFALGTSPVFAQSIPTLTLAQAERGKVAYAQSCARCHGADLSDGRFGSPLRGSAFSARWAERSVGELLTYIKQTMPPGEIGTLDDATHLQVTAYLLARNGVTPGDVALPSDMQTLAAMRFPRPTSGEFDARNVLNPLAANAVLPPWPSAPNPLERFAPVSEALLNNPAPQDWLTWRRGYDGQGFSPLQQIDKKNVHDLRLSWSLALPAGANEATPLVHDGVLFVHAPDNSVLALNAATGTLLWRYKYQNRSEPSKFPAMVRNMALYGTRLYLTTPDTRVIALDVRTGTLAWERAVDDPALWATTGGPLVANGKVMQGVAGRGPGGAFIVGLDADTGRELWRFHSVAQSGDANESTWNATPLAQRTGGSVWVAGSYDPELKLAYFGTAQTYDTALLLRPVKQRGISNEGLYLDATIALDPETGKAKWHYQHLANDQWDYDFAFERHIVELPINGKLTKTVVTAGKPAIYDALAAESGAYLFSVDLGLQNVITGINPKTGVKQIDPKKYPGQGTLANVCPHSGGAKSWLPGSYNPHTHIVYVPLVEACMDMVPVGADESAPLSSGYTFTLRPRADSDGRYGRIEAVNLVTRKSVWQARQRAPQTSGVLATAGGVVFAGALDRSFSAYDDTTGELLWKSILSDVPSAAPISYAVDGRQYVAIVVGYGAPQAATFTALTPEITLPQGSSCSVWVFELRNESVIR